MTTDYQYNNLIKEILSYGVHVKHKRTGLTRKTLYGRTLIYTSGEFPIITTRKVPYISAIKEMLCYIRGYNNINQFRATGLKTWDATYEQWSGKNKDGDMGPIYGTQWRNWADPVFNNVDQLKEVIDKLLNRNDDSNLVMTAVNPGETHAMCMPACMHTHRWSLADDGVLHQHSFQRSSDAPLGLVFNMIQASWLLQVICRITGLRPGVISHHLDNVHIYENQIDTVKAQLANTPLDCEPKLILPDSLNDLNDLDYIVKAEDFKIEGYESHGVINHPLAG